MAASKAKLPAQVATQAMPGSGAAGTNTDAVSSRASLPPATATMLCPASTGTPAGAGAGLCAR